LLNTIRLLKLLRLLSTLGLLKMLRLLNTIGLLKLLRLLKLLGLLSLPGVLNLVGPFSMLGLFALKATVHIARRRPRSHRLQWLQRHSRSSTVRPEPQFESSLSLKCVCIFAQCPHSYAGLISTRGRPDRHSLRPEGGVAHQPDSEFVCQLRPDLSLQKLHIRALRHFYIAQHLAFQLLNDI
jgi:hypothetical protein